MKRNLRNLLFLTPATLLPYIVSAATISVDATKEIVTVNRANLLGINVAIYNDPADFEWAMTDGPFGDLDIGLVRVPGGSVSDRYYWNGNGVVQNGKADPSRYKAPHWQVDYSAYKPGFVTDSKDWSKTDTRVVRIDAKTMHEVTRKHPASRNLVTINAGSGTPEMAAEWVRWANIQNKWGVKYWEIGNELNGAWEAGHIRPDGSKMTAEKYAEIFVKFAKAMKAVDPTIKIGGPSCDIRHEDDYFEPLLKQAGDQIDFLTLHFYSLRSSLAPESELFSGLKNLKPATDRLDALVKKYQPKRFGKIEYSITEWNSKLPKDQEAYRLFNGLWFSAWIGEMIECGIDSATVWDMFSGDDNGHGMLVRQGDTYVPTGRYWGFWLWSHCMADTLVESSVDSNLLHVYATRDADNVYVMVMNESRTESFPVKFNLKGFSAKTGTITTLSSREYFRNPVTHTTDWNSGPVSNPWKKAEPSPNNSSNPRNESTEIPPYCVNVFRFSKNTLSPNIPPSVGKAKLDLVLPPSGFGDLEVEGWVRAVNKGTMDPFAKDLGKVNLTATGSAEITQIEPTLSGATAKFILKPNGPGPVTVTAECAGLKTKQKIDFHPVVFEKQVAWTFDKMPEASESRLQPSIKDGRLKLLFNSETVKPPNNHIFDIKKYPHSVPKERIGGVLFDLNVSKDWKTSTADGASPTQSKLQVVLQSHGAYWIPCGETILTPGEQQTLQMEIPDKKFLKVMDQDFAVLFLLSTDGNVSGSIEIDNLGFLLRPKK